MDYAWHNQLYIAKNGLHSLETVCVFLDTFSLTHNFSLIPLQCDALCYMSLFCERFLGCLLFLYFFFFFLFELWWLEYWIACVSVYFFCLFFVYCSHNSSSFLCLLLTLCSIEGILRLSLRQYIKYLYVFSKFWYHPEKLRRKLRLLKLVR